MSVTTFSPTPEQRIVICHDAEAFVSACPGAGKTRVMVERTTRLLRASPPGRGVAFLSFTRAAISELQTRLRAAAILPQPLFPNFIGTFDSFIWQFLIAPLGGVSADTRPRIIPDIDKLEVAPYPGAQPVSLACFDRSSGVMNHSAAKRAGFDPAKRKNYQLRQYETAAETLRLRLSERGQLGFDDARSLALG